MVGWLVCFKFQFNVSHFIQTVIKFSQTSMPPELISLFKAKMMAEISLSSQIFINSSGYHFFNGISEGLCNAEDFSTDLEKKKKK